VNDSPTRYSGSCCNYYLIIDSMQTTLDRIMSTVTIALLLQIGTSAAEVSRNRGKKYLLYKNCLSSILNIYLLT